jgi:transcriptional regulator with GAF, ATPase, and Fis domain
MIMAKGPQLRIEPPGPPGRTAVASVLHRTIAEVDREHIRCVLEMTGWRIRGKRGAAQILGLKPTTLETRMAKLGIHRPTRARTE